MSRLREPARILLALAVAAIGVLHFLTPDPFVSIVPRALPAPLWLVWISGACELGLAAALATPWPRAQRLAGWGLVALFVAVFPANVNMAVNDVRAFGEDVPGWVAWARLPLQIGLVWWAVWLARTVRAA